MVWIGIVLLILLFIFLVIILTKLNVHIKYYHGQDNDDLSITIKAWYGLITYKIDVPLIKIDKKSSSIVFKEKIKTGPAETTKKEEMKKFSAEDLLRGLKDFKEILTHVVSLHKIVRLFLRKVSIKKIEWNSMVGIGDAANTGTLVGGLWILKGGLIGVISNYMRMKEMPLISITPNFQKAISQTRFSCMIQFRIGNAMLAGIKLVKYWKGGRPKFRSKPLSKFSEEKTKTI
jgi:hypothetical protein